MVRESGAALDRGAEHRDVLLRLADSLKLDVVQASGLIRTLPSNNSPTRLARALAETRSHHQDQHHPGAA
jgi:hypothetical protein